MTLIRPLQGMPEGVAHLLGERGLYQDYGTRPVYQRNDYLAWITRAKCSAIRVKRIDQMLSGLEMGGVYMRMRHASFEH